MPDRTKIKKIVTNLLLVFVLVTIGFSLGKHSVLRRMTADAATVSASKSSQTDGKKAVKVFYMHSTFRCVTCSGAETLALELVDKEFADARKNQTLLWEDVNFQENAILAKQFDVIASCMVVAIIENDEIVDFVRLDDVLTLSDKPEEFNAYVRNALNNALSKISGE
ncbi:MAG: hypothetical protein CVV41_15600 [Candidatus Riflebacteria bacterium HGW-Riflebacteria-1]|jgi:hypothetical protein|nr:MAG: hypothetical protein CVV41_15600 [Candidatus Riflebacteria bacterium HGW-Riflebacteria-1]